MFNEEKFMENNRTALISVSAQKFFQKWISFSSHNNNAQIFRKWWAGYQTLQLREIQHDRIKCLYFSKEELCLLIHFETSIQASHKSFV